MSEHKMKPIWYFVGLILMTMGGLIFLSGLYQILYPPAVKTVLADTHPDVWWGGIMVAFGGLLFWRTHKQSA